MATNPKLFLCYDLITIRIKMIYLLYIYFFVRQFLTHEKAKLYLMDRNGLAFQESGDL